MNISHITAGDEYADCVFIIPWVLLAYTMSFWQ